jgi:hypothetical protein
MARKRELVIWMENRPGSLAKIGNTLRENDVNILALMASGRQGLTPFHLMVDNVSEARTALETLGGRVEERWVVTLELANRPGTLGTAMDILALKGININYCYYSVTDGTSAYVVLGVADPRSVESLLKHTTQGNVQRRGQ